MASRKPLGFSYPKIISPSLGPLWHCPEPPCLPRPCPPPHEPRVPAPPSSLPPPLPPPPPSSLPPPLPPAPPLPPGFPFLFPVPPPPAAASPSHHISPWLVVFLVLLGLLLFVVASVAMIRCCLRAKREREAAAAADEEAMQRRADVPGEFRRSELRSVPLPSQPMRSFSAGTSGSLPDPRQSTRAETRRSLKNYMHIVFAL